jgi:3-phosphoshikimate 1-carboxyvinyltransferase
MFMGNKVVLPASKSLSNRVLSFGLVTKLDLSNVLQSEDTEVMLAALVRLGAKVTKKSLGINMDVVVIPPDLSDLKAKFELNLGNAGTATRFLLAMLALGSFTFQEILFDGVERMRERPIADLVDALVELGARIEYLAKPGFLPLKVYPRQVDLGHKLKQQIRVKQEVSSQYLSGLLLALAVLPSEVEIFREQMRVSDTYIELTVALLERLGVDVDVCELSGTLKVRGGHGLKPIDYVVEPDWSAASYWVLRSLIMTMPINLVGLDFASKQGDRKFAELLVDSGLLNVVAEAGSLVFRPVSDRPDWDKLPAQIDCLDFPDASMTLMSLLAFCPKRVELIGLGTLKYKECDRIEAMATELRKLGVLVETTDSTMTIVGRDLPHFQNLEPLVLATYGDHRMAMSLAIFRLLNEGVDFDAPSVCQKTYPSFWNDYGGLNSRF